MDKPPTAPATATLSPATLARAPHRLLFFIGAANVLLAMFRWTLWLVEARWHVLDLPQPDVYGGWLHAIGMQYPELPPFSSEERRGGNEYALSGSSRRAP